MRGFEVKRVDPPPVYHLSIELTDEEVKRMNREMGGQFLPPTVAFVIRNLVQSCETARRQH